MKYILEKVCVSRVGFLATRDYAILGNIVTKLRFSKYLPIEKVCETIFTLRQVYNVGYFEVTYFYKDKVMFFNDAINRNIIIIFPLKDYKKMKKIDKLQIGVIYIGNNEKCLLENKEDVYTIITERINSITYELNEETKKKKINNKIILKSKNQLWNENEKLKEENEDLRRLNYQYENQYKSLKEKTDYLINQLNKVFQKLPEFIKTIVDHLFNHSSLDLKYFKQQYDPEVKRKEEKRFKGFNLFNKKKIEKATNHIN